MKKLKGLIVTVFMGFIGFIVHAQNFPSGFNYQGILRTDEGVPMISAELDLIIGIYSGPSSDILVWEESQSATTNTDGYYQLVIGEGTFTGQGLVSDFNAINWSEGNYAINIEIDYGSGFEDFGMNELFSVPFAYYAKQAGNQLYLNNMIDLDTTSILTGDILRWNGINWQVFPYSDTVSWAVSALYAENTSYADTASWAYSALACPPCDTSNFTYYGDSALWSIYSDTADYSLFSSYSDTALVALESLGTWKLDGNEGMDPPILGTLDSNDIRIITNEQERIVIKADGKIGIGITDPKYDLHINGNRGVLFSGDYGGEITLIPDTGSATFWLPTKSAFRTGYVNNDAWNFDNIGDYSFAGGYNCKASGDKSFAFGELSTASGETAIAMGYGASASKKYAIAMGAQAKASAYSSISLGRFTQSLDSMSIAMGYWTKSNGNSAIALGRYSEALSDYSIALGNKARTMHEGAIVFSDRSSNDFTVSTADNQFMVRAAGGTIIYSDAAMTTGVSLAAGSGSWSTLSDSTLKENIIVPDIDQIVHNAKDLDVYSWNYIAQNDSIRHIGPMAQDFYAAFGLGESENTISAVDFDGINLLLLKILIQKEEELSEKIKYIEKINIELEQMSSEYDFIIKKVQTLIQY